MDLSFDQSSVIEQVDTRRQSFEASTLLTMVKKKKALLEGAGDTIKAGGWSGNTIGVFTSGGDSQGMNAAVRAIVRVGMYLGCKVFYIKEGYQGMVDGGDQIQEATWSSTSNIIHVGGTVIGSARCMDFKQRAGRLKAARNLIQHGITNLIAIGGDGSLTGANCFRQEWPSLLRELLDKDMITKDKVNTCSHLNIVGLVGSIDNDFCGTDMTIGVDSALHRIMEAVDNITTTAVSHKRAFVLEVMGRMCGYLPLAAGLSSEASTIFIPEDPPKGDWRQHVVDQLMEKSKAGEVRRTHIVLVAEGAIDHDGNPIKCNDVKKALTDLMKMDVRVTVLGHVQRGGTTSAFDRLLGTRMGAEAVLALVDATRSTPACVISLDGSDIVRTNLLKAVEKTKMVGEKMAEKNYEEVVRLRGRAIYHNLFVYMMQRKVIPHPSLSQRGRKKKIYRIAMIHVGHPACGMNAVARGFVSVCVTKGFEPLFIYDSWDGFCHKRVKVVTWNEVHHWTNLGGSLIGTNVKTANDVDVRFIATRIQEFDISGLIIVGGFEAFQSAYEILQGRSDYPELCIPINVVPTTIANNVPGCDLALGADTAMNQICEACDELKQSAFSIQKCVYVVEVGGDNCGYLATLAALGAGADFAFIREEPYSVRDIQTICKRLIHKLENSGVKHGLILCNENANGNLTTDFIYRIVKEEGKPNITARKTVLGHHQEGNVTSPYDRCAGIKAGCRSVSWMIINVEANMEKGVKGTVYTDDPETITVLTTRLGKISFVPILELVRETDFENRLPQYQWWMKLRSLLKILSWPADTALYEDADRGMSL